MMSTVLLRFVLAVGLCCLALFVGMAYTAEPVYAQSADQELAQRKGLSAKKIDKEKLPNKWEVGLGLGSLVVMIAVVKYL